MSVHKHIYSGIQEMPLLYDSRYFTAAFPSFPPYYNLEPAQSSVRPPNSTFKTYFNIILCNLYSHYSSPSSFTKELSTVRLSRTVHAISVIKFGLMKVIIFCAV